MSADPMTTTQAPEGDASMLAGLDTMRRIVAHWIKYDTEVRAQEGLTTGPETHLVAPPHWPSHGSLAAWVETLSQAHSALSVPVNGQGSGLSADADTHRGAGPAVVAALRLARATLDRCGQQVWADTRASVFDAAPLAAALNAIDAVLDGEAR